MQLVPSYSWIPVGSKVTTQKKMASIPSPWGIQVTSSTRDAIFFLSSYNQQQNKHYSFKKRFKNFPNANGGKDPVTEAFNEKTKQTNKKKKKKKKSFIIQN